MGRVLALQHIWDNPEGYLGELLHEYGIEYEVVNVETDDLPDPTAYTAVIAFGGSQHVYAEDQYPYFVQEQQLIRTVLEKEIPFLGICLGSQLLAKVLGSEVRKHTMTEIGFFDVEITEAGKKDPLYAGLPGYQKIYHWHADTFTLPTGATLLATHQNTENQAFRYGRRAYGIQYHVELNPEMLHLWLHHPDARQSV
ncbi:MAG TPA: type 1 glutamine amidotransferase, partial [Ktedonobacteraceae bacterium]